VARRRMVLRHIDPFTVLKFGAVANLAVAAIGVLTLAIVVRFALGTGLTEQVCDIATDVGFVDCGFRLGPILRLLLVLGLVWAVVQTALLVLLAFLHNLISDLTGGIAVTMDVEGPNHRPAVPEPRPSTGDEYGSVPARPGPAGPDDETTTVATVDAIEAVVSPRPRAPGTTPPRPPAPTPDGPATPRPDPGARRPPGDGTSLFGGR